MTQPAGEDRPSPGAAADPGTADPGAALDGLSPARGSRFVPVVLSGVWLVYLANPLQTMLDHPAGPARDLGLVALVAFAAAYVALFHHLSRRRRALQFAPDTRDLTLIAVMAVLVPSMVPAAGSEALAGLVYVAAAVMMVAPLAVGWALVVALLVVCEASAFLVEGWQDQSGAGLGILLAGMAVFGLRTAMERNRQLLSARGDLARLAVEQERSRFARDLHDILGHSLTVVTVKAELAGRLVESDPHRAAGEIGDVERLAREALADVRAAVSGYRGVTLSAELVSARSTLAAAGIEAELPTAVDDVPGERRELFGWAVREGITNVVRHSGARRCTVLVSPTGVEVVDDGRGPGEGGLVTDAGRAGPQRRGGHGLIGLRERAEAVGASVVAGSVDPHGFRLRVELAEGRA